MNFKDKFTWISTVVCAGGLLGIIFPKVVGYIMWIAFIGGALCVGINIWREQQRVKEKEKK